MKYPVLRMSRRLYTNKSLHKIAYEVDFSVIFMGFFWDLLGKCTFFKWFTPHFYRESWWLVLLNFPSCCLKFGWTSIKKTKNLVSTHVQGRRITFESGGYIWFTIATMVGANESQGNEPRNFLKITPSSGFCPRPELFLITQKIIRLSLWNFWQLTNIY